ncbi:MtrAB system histidine kinase MtrB [Herbiconiux sp. L3-i23]|uniref:MtrAB system histidine kinase MtrB n=1 Tax=Herbiconiux sp. L3-i23 TaxID=2905871 RepID=UPI002060B64A|nr:MtrAB system histidine kinase MtrB [Herbiconiux sp. L3-i23]BDI21690.1 two-component sensor histidine kinase [Herbiconiux sp. L3-i23]
MTAAHDGGAAGRTGLPLGIRLAGFGRSAGEVGRSVAGVFRRSLELRIIGITVGLSTLAILATGTYMAHTIGDGLFDARVLQVEEEAARATTTAQDTFSSSTASDDASISVLQQAVLDDVSTIATSSTGIWFVRGPDTEATIALPEASRGRVDEVVTQALRQQVSSGEDPQHWQSVTIPDSGDEPGIVVGSEVEVPGAGVYEMYLLFDLSDVQESLGFVQGTLLIGGILLVLLIAAVSWAVVQFVISPIRVAAETSRKLAAGQLEERIPVRGDDVLATLAQSFNGMADSLQRQITQLAGLSQVQQRFVSDVSHELRTPLTTIRLAGDVLYDRREQFDPTTARTAELLHTQVERFELLLADLLEISRYDAQAVDIDREPVNLVRLAEDAIAGVESLAERKGSTLTLVAPGGHFESEMDARRIRRIVRNLLSNAIEHGEGRPIEVTVDSNGTAVALSVRDHGIGMTRADAARVFDRFWRADPSRQRTTGGTGLGLAISLEDAALHGGRLDVWSEEGAGSCFRLTLPRRVGAALGESPLPLGPSEAT